MLSFLRIERLVARVAEYVNWAAAAMLVGMMLLTVADVVGRLFKSPIPGTFELMGFMGSAVIAFALPYTSVKKGHIAVEFLVQKLPWLARVIINAAGALVAAVLFGVISWRCLVFGMGLRSSAEVSLTLKVPTYPFVYGIAAGCALLSVVLLLEFARQLRGAEIE